jgi:hypothetical protein
MGAVRVDAQSSTMSTVAFVNTDGSQVLVARRAPGSGSASVTIAGLKPGTYGMRTATVSASQATDLADVVVPAAGSVTVSLPEGYTTLYGRALPMPGTGMVSNNPYGPLSVFGGSLVGNTISDLQPGAVIQLGATTGAANSYLEIDFQGLNIASGNTLTVQSGAAGQTVVFRNADNNSSVIGGSLLAQSGNGAPPPYLVLDNQNGVTVSVGGSISSAGGATVSGLGNTWTSGQAVMNDGYIGGGPLLDVQGYGITGGGNFVGDAIVLSTVTNANNPVNGGHYLSNSLQLYPSSSSDAYVTLHAYGSNPQFLNVKVNGNTYLAMPSAWGAGVTAPSNNSPVPAGSSRPAGVPEPSFGGGSMIVQATGNMTLIDGASHDFVFPGGIVLKAGNTLNLNGVVVNQGWTTTGKAFQGINFEAPSITTPALVSVLSNDLNWTNFSVQPAGHFQISRLTTMQDGSAQYVAADGVAAHNNTYSVLIEAAANGQCWTCLVNYTPINVQ